MPVQVRNIQLMLIRDCVSTRQNISKQRIVQAFPQPRIDNSERSACEATNVEACHPPGLSTRQNSSFPRGHYFDSTFSTVRKVSHLEKDPQRKYDLDGLDAIHSENPPDRLPTKVNDRGSI